MKNLKQHFNRKKTNETYGFSDEQMKDSYRAIEFFFQLLPKYVPLNPRNIAFVLDYPRPFIYTDAIVFDQVSRKQIEKLRDYFIAKANKQGYKIVDMEKYYKDDFKKNHIRFEFPTDGHWNERGHKVVCEAVLQELFGSD